MKRRFVIRHMQGDHAYTIKAAAKTVKVTENAIKLWIQRGELKTIDRKRPTLIHLPLSSYRPEANN